MPSIPAIPFYDEIPSELILGDTSAEIKLSNAIEFRDTALLLASQARYSMNIFTQDLDDAVYNNDEFVNHVFNFAKRHPSAQLRIIVHDSRKAVKNGHRLIRLAQTLTSSILIKNPAEMHQDDNSAFMTVDGVGLLYRVHGDNRNYEGAANFMSALRVKNLADFFDKSWGHGTRDQKIRRLCI